MKCANMTRIVSANRALMSEISAQEDRNIQLTFSAKLFQEPSACLALCI